MRFAIMRAAKLGSAAEVRRSLNHAFREQPTPNADPSRTGLNVHHEAATTDEAIGRMKALLPAKRRKDAVLLVEYVLTASPEWWEGCTPEQKSGFFEKARGWIDAKYGADRVVVATEHHDETSPHLSVFVVPLTRDGRLSAKEFIGARSQMALDQDSFHEAVASLGLVRGVRRSKAEHVPIREYYARIQGPVNVPKITPETVTPKVLKSGWLSNEVESPEEVAQRVSKVVQEAYAPAVEAYRTWNGGRQSRLRAADAHKQAQEALKSAADATEEAEKKASYLEWLKSAIERHEAEFDAGVKKQAQLVAEIHRLEDVRQRASKYDDDNDFQPT